MGGKTFSSDPAIEALAITPNDSADIGNNSCRALYVGTAGALKVTTDKGSQVTFGNVGVGVLPLRVIRVWSTGTTASNIVALY